MNQIARRNSLWSFLIVEELIRHGCDYFCISPGSRSTPLTLAVAQNSKAKSNIFYDERGAAFHALGYSKANKKAAVLICTSGTAVANYFPAIIEAYQDSVPLIILSADRPPELKDCGANQTIDQVKIFNNYTKWYFELPAPDENISFEFVLSTIDHAYAKSINSSKGPVHINCMFREPFYEKDYSIDFKNQKIEKWQKFNIPFTQYRLPKNKFIPDFEFIEKVNKSSYGIIIVGKIDNQSDSIAVLELAEKLNWPIFADISSGLRLNKESNLIIEYFDLLLLSKSFKESLKPDTIIQFGKRFVSKRLLQFLNNSKTQTYILIDDTSNRYDPLSLVTERITANIEDYCKSIIPQIKTNNINDLFNKISLQNSKVKKLIINESKSENALSEISVAINISKHIPENSGLFLANSMPVRDMDMFAFKGKKNISVITNRGASGIDGNIATAAGFALGNKSKVTLIIGDLAFVHDLNSLHQLNKTDYPVIIVLLNNHGGGIFSFLPIANQTEHFEKYFGTPNELNFKFAASLFNLNYYHPKSNQEFIKNYITATNNKKSTIIELSLNRNENFNLHKSYYKKIVELLEK